MCVHRRPVDGLVARSARRGGTSFLSNNVKHRGPVTIARVGGTCERCGGPARLRRYCGSCRTTVNDLTRQYVDAACSILAAGGPLGPDWSELERWRESVALPAADARQAIADISIDWLRRYAAFAAADGVVNKEELSYFRRAAEILDGEPSPLVQRLDSQLYREYMICDVYAGNLPRASAAGLHLPTDEHCYLNVPATRRRYLKSGTQLTPGQLIVTNRKLRFSAFQRGGEMPLSKLLSASYSNVLVLSLEATSGSISGDYIVQDAEWAAAVINTTLRIDRRTLLPASSRRTPIPQHVRNEVWQRDHGRCVQCHATDYLEFDHIIPRSRGGADTVGNIQILCRRCNLAKSNRI